LDSIDEILREENGKGFLDVVRGIMEDKNRQHSPLYGF